MTEWNIEKQTGYKPKTTFWADFSIADTFGLSAIKDTYKRAFDNWKENYEYLTELSMVLNWKLWEFYGKNNEYYELYQNLWDETDEYAVGNLKGEGLEYYYRVTD